MKEGPDGHEDLRHPENRSPLREVSVKLLAPKHSSFHSVPQKPIAPHPVTSSRLRRRDLRSSVPLFLRLITSSRSRRLDFFLHGICAGLVSESRRISSDITLQLVTSCLHHVQPHHKPTRATIPKMGRRGGDLANRLDQTSYFAWIMSQRPSASREQQTGYSSRRRCYSTRRMESKSIIFPSLSPPLGSSPRSRRTEEVARWKGSS